VTVTMQHLKVFEETGETSTIRAKYVVGSDGSRSGTREAIGRELAGDAMNQSWGVVDALAVTDFRTSGSSARSTPRTRATS
jgi:phenol 2-monooxygenase (NADPH)